MYNEAYGDVKTKAISAENQWTDPVTIYNKGMVLLANTNLVATLSLQIQNSSKEWVTADTDSILTGVDHVYEFTGRKVLARVGVATGGFTSGAGTVELRG